MWWHTLPCAVVIASCWTLIPMVYYARNQILYGNPYRRYLYYNSDRLFLLRDARVSGVKNPYVQRGLDSLPEPEAAKK